LERELRRDTRAEILDTAEHLLRTKSFHCFSLQDVSDRLGIRKASLYYYFASKSELGLALIERLRERFRQWCCDLEHPPLPPVERLDAYFRFFERHLARDQICGGGVLAAEFNAISPDMQAALRQLVSDHHLWLTDLLSEGRAVGAFGFAGRPADQAALVSATVQGALQQARACGRDTFRAVGDQLRRSLLA
jgi:TetR/AcrR family transcriptional repressor of nem operon